jgi:integrase
MRARPLNDAEILGVLTYLQSPRDRALFVFGMRTGFRISEILSLKVADLVQYGVMADTVTVRRSSMKGKRQSRSVPLHSQAKEAISDYLKTRSYHPDSRLFEMTRQHAWRILKEAAYKAHLSGTISTHSMRKTFGMNVYNRTNKNVVAAQRALGHVSLASTSHYLSIGQDEVDAAILA